jgi:hypothetical protein
MGYKINSLPIEPVFAERTRKELKIYYDWYLSSIPDRIEILIDEVRKQEKFKLISFDYEPETLLPLGEWFASTVETRARTEEELESLEGGSNFSIEVSKYELTNKTFSIAVDVGMYFGQVFLKKFDDLKWIQPLGGKKFVDYGQPILSPFNKGAFNPTRMMIVQAYGISDGSKDARGLFELFNFWANIKQTAS